MAYARWGVEDSKYYIFWLSSKAKTKEGQLLAIWHAHFRGQGSGGDFTYAEVKSMLTHDDFTAILGFATGDEDFLRPKLQEFISDIDEAYEEPILASAHSGGLHPVSLYIEHLKDPRASIRRKAALALSFVSDPQAFDPLMIALLDSEASVREAAALALGKLGDDRAVEALIRCLSDQNMFVCYYAIVALGKIGDERALEPLKYLQASGTIPLSLAAGDALAKLGHR